MTSSNKNRGFETGVGKALGPDGGCLVVAVDKDGGLLPGDSQLNVDGKTNDELVDWEGDVLAEYIACIGHFLQLDHSGDDVDTSAECHPVSGTVLGSETGALVLGVTAADSGSLGVNVGDVGDEFRSTSGSGILFSCGVHVWPLTVGEVEVDTSAEVWCSYGGRGSSQMSGFAVLDLDVSLVGDLTLVGDGNVVNGEAVDTGEQNSLVEADFESLSADITEPVVDELLRVRGMGRQFDGGHIGHGLQEVH